MWKKKININGFNIINYTVMFFLLFICLYPFWYVFIYTISNPDTAIDIVLLPKDLTIQNYIKVLELDGIFSATGMSVARTVIGTLVHVTCVMFLGYLFTKPMYCRKFFYRMVVITMYISGGVIPTYLVYMTYGLTNSFWIYILPAAVSAYNVILCKTFVENLPVSLEESARLDGAGHLVIFWKIVLPLSKAIVATIVVFSAVAQWNAWTDNYIYNTSGKFDTLQLILKTYLNEATQMAALLEATGDVDILLDYQPTPMSIRMTITMVTLIPILCVYPYMQRYFVKGVMVGAIKG